MAGILERVGRSQYRERMKVLQVKILEDGTVKLLGGTIRILLSGLSSVACGDDHFIIGTH
jgi:hypothetical protein